MQITKDELEKDEEAGQDISIEGEENFNEKLKSL